MRTATCRWQNKETIVHTCGEYHQRVVSFDQSCCRRDWAAGEYPRKLRSPVCPCPPCEWSSQVHCSTPVNSRVRAHRLHLRPSTHAPETGFRNRRHNSGASFFRAYVRLLTSLTAFRLHKCYLSRRAVFIQ